MTWGTSLAQQAPLPPEQAHQSNPFFFFLHDPEKIQAFLKSDSHQKVCYQIWWCPLASSALLITFEVISVWAASISPTLLEPTETPLKCFCSSSSGSFGHGNYSALILLAPESPYSFSRVTNTCLNHIPETLLYVPLATTRSIMIDWNLSSDFS